MKIHLQKYDYDKCFYYAVKVALNHNWNWGKKEEQNLQIQSFINQYVCYVKDYLAAAIEWKIFKRNNPAIALDVLATKTNRKGIKNARIRW